MDMIICLTGFSCTGKTTVSKLISDMYGYSLISYRSVSRNLAIEKGYKRTREWLEKVSTNDYLEECRGKILELIDNNKNYIIDDLFDICLWEDIKNKFDSVLISFELQSEERIKRMCKREELDLKNATHELAFLDKWKEEFGIKKVIDNASMYLNVEGYTSWDIVNEICEKYIVRNLFLDEIGAYKNLIDCEIQKQSIPEYLNLNFMKPYINNFMDFCNDGKRIRAYLVKLGYEITGKKFNADIVKASLSYELFQSGVLIHDDIIDKSDVRRKKPTMHIRLNDDNDNDIGISKAICVGDMGILLAIEIIGKMSLNDNILREAIKHQIKVFNLTIAGELKDIELSKDKECSEDDIIEMYKLKTSWYTIIGPMQLGAILGKANDEMLLNIEKFGINAGIAFQIVDDIVGIFGTTDVVGKSNLSDMREGKKTIITEYFIRNCNEEQMQLFDELYGKETSGEKELNVIKKLFVDTGAYDYAKNKCNIYIDNAKEIIYNMDIDDKNKKILNDFVLYLSKRKF